MELTEKSIIDLIDQGAEEWNNWVKELTKNVRGIKLHSDKSLRNYQSYHISLSIASLPKMKLSRRKFKQFDFSRLKIQSSEFNYVEFDDCDFFETQFDNSKFNYCIFKNCTFKKTYFIGANLNYSKFNNCKFIGCNLSKTEQYLTKYDNCTILYTYLKFANLTETHLYKTTIDSSKIYGVSTWGIKIEGSISKNLIITNDIEDNSSEISVDNIEIAQFIYMLIDNRKIRDVVTSLTSKVILILGRFTDERLEVLEGIKQKIRELGYIPVLFTFSPSLNRDLTETIQLIANISKMVFADITDPKSIPQELSTIIPNLPSLKVQPLLLEGNREYAMFEHWNRYPWVEDIFEYSSEQHLLSNVQKLINKSS
ncbi:hypothetical protein GCM10011344_42580 [Dokdonia pacifica]|uniref:Uncharacterized protein YjbI, contains pentapeptide repeats n=1 Tax=Dokdonia pacifica TaxID=1627892 RepID=A0A239DMM3_9FLAO|nr:pentapeptide repeat-containing protein [Dokdonia pacifica]GGG37263.1 hypothetical protein GCM10011344_42580 [Dokdonia pacifica]SNS33885.1 Uncharacterized protein YjbI, contains pentapeptide repeats [Dokdonia pacifica]